ncbi:hypothetical protein [Sphingomonas sp. KR3-1]|uniref:hypothetical protein n=1 Tax=Sphingomonas sp. KR3-1 TaxID=3156611 RepID=UPI0032B58C79
MQAKRYRPIPGTIGLFFGGVWGVFGAQALSQDWRSAGIAGAVLVTAVLIALLWRSGGGTGGGLFRKRTYYLAVALEVAAIAAANLLMPRLGLTGYALQILGLIIGLHFIGLWKASDMARFLGIAAGMTVLSLAACALPAPLRDMVTGFGNALVLWIGAARVRPER